MPERTRRGRRENIAEEYTAAMNAFLNRLGLTFTEKQLQELRRGMTRSTYSAMLPGPEEERHHLDLAEGGDSILARRFRRWVAETEPKTPEARTARAAMQNFLLSNVFFSSLALKLRLNSIVRMQGFEARAQNPALKARKLADAFEAFINILQGSHGKKTTEALLDELIYKAPELDFYSELMSSSPEKMRQSLSVLTGGACRFEESILEDGRNNIRITMQDGVPAVGIDNHLDGALRSAILNFIKANPWLIWRYDDPVTGEETAYEGNATPYYRFAVFRKF